MSKFILGGIPFNSKKEIEIFVRSLFKQYGKDFKIEVNHSLYVFFFDLLKMHPDFDEKIKNGVSAFIFGRNQMHDFIELQIADISGYIQPMNWKRCISGKKKNKDLEIYEAMRSAIIHQIDFFRETNAKPSICPVCSETKETYHVDHIIPFRAIADDFITRYGKPFSFAKLKCHLTVFAQEDKTYENTWVDFHRDKAKLRWLCSSCNIRKGSKPDIT